MISIARRAVDQPLWVIAALWPLVLLTPSLPGLPRPNISGPSWRQETALAFLLCVTLGLLAKRARRAASQMVLSIRRCELFLIVPLALFVLWSAASITWAVSSYPAFHHTLTWGAYLLFFLLMRRVVEHQRLLRVSITTLTLVVLIIATSSAIGYWSGTDARLRYTGLGEPFAVLVPFLAALALCLRRRRASLLCGITAVLSWLTMLQATERAPFISACAGLLLLAIMMTALPKFRPRALSRVLVLIAALLAVTMLQTVPSPLANNKPSVIARLQTTTPADTNTRARFLFWGVGVEMVRAYPLTGVGANNYEVVFPEARAQIVARYPHSRIVEMNEGFLTIRAHNEYVQIAAELGVIGLMLFVAFSAALVWLAARALLRAHSPLVPGAIASLLTFALSSGASSISFRWMGSGLLFFLAAAIVARFGANAALRGAEPAMTLAPVLMRRATVPAFVLALVMFCGMSAQGLNVMLHGAAQSTARLDRTDYLYRAALRWNPYDAATHFNYGLWLYTNGRAEAAVPHIRYATARGFNASMCYEYQVAAEMEAGQSAAAERTLAHAVAVYPRSVFLRTRYAVALAENGKTREAEREYNAALAIDSRAARGWRQLIRFGVDAAVLAARNDSGIALPGELQPEDCVFAVLAENKRRSLWQPARIVSSSPANKSMSAPDFRPAL